jgi:hypothetical protein
MNHRIDLPSHAPVAVLLFAVWLPLGCGQSTLDAGSDKSDDATTASTPPPDSGEEAGSDEGGSGTDDSDNGGSAGGDSSGAGTGNTDTGDVPEGVDADGDGATVEEGDCDDNDPNVYPAARDLCANDIDEDCDGRVDVPNCGDWPTCYADCLQAHAPKAWWRLGEPEGASMAVDATGGGRDGTYRNLATGSLGIPGVMTDDPDTAIDLGGFTDWIDFGDTLDLGADSLSISLWMRTTNTQGYVLGKSDPGATDGRFGIGLTGTRLDTTGNPAGVAFFVDGGTSSDLFYESTATVADGNWHNVVVTIDRFGDATLYVDGIVDGTWSTAPYASQSFDTDNLLSIGLLHAEYATASDPVEGHPYDGAVDEVAFFDRVLTPEEVALLYSLLR